MNYEVDNGFVCFEFNLVRDNQTRSGRAMRKLFRPLHRLREIPSHGERTANEWWNMFLCLYESQQSQKNGFCLKIQVINDGISTPSHTATVFLPVFCTHRGFIFHFYFGPNRFSQICVTNFGPFGRVSSLFSRFVWQASCRQSQLSSIIGPNNRIEAFLPAQFDREIKQAWNARHSSSIHRSFVKREVVLSCIAFLPL